MKAQKSSRLTIFLYATSDEPFQLEIKAHLDQQFKSKDIGRIRYQTIDDFFPLKDSLHHLITNTTTFICLLSPHFFASSFSKSIELKKIITAHVLKGMKVIPIELFDVNLPTTLFNSFESLSSNQKPLYSSHKEIYQHRLSLLATEMADEVNSANAYEQAMDQAWTNAKKSKSIEKYELFLHSFQYSPYSHEAQVHLDELKEEKLWKEAVAFDEIQYYLNYLLETPLKKYEEEAVDKIMELEADDSIAGRDAIDNSNLALLYDYKRRFPKGIHLTEVNEKIFSLLSRPIESLKMERPHILQKGESAEYLQGLIPEQEGLQLKGSLLNYLVHKKNTPSEIFAFEHLQDFNNYLHKKLKKLKSELSGIAISLFVLPFVFLTIVAFSLLVISFGYLTFNVWMALFFAILIYFSYRASVAYTVIVKENQKKCEYKLKEAKKNLIRLKVAFISHDRIQINRFILFFQNTDEWANQLLSQNALTYILHDPEIVEEEPPVLILDGLS